MKTMQPIRVLIMDDHTVVCRGLLTFLKNEPELKLVGEARGGRPTLAPEAMQALNQPHSEAETKEN